MPSTTLSSLSSRIYSRLDNNSTLYTQTEVTAAINENIRYINVVTGYIQGTGTVNTVSNQFWYSTPAGIIVPTRLQWNGVFLEKVGLNQLGLRYANMLTETTSNQGLPVSEWACSGLRTFAIHPADSVASNTLVMTGVIEPTPLAAAGDVVQLPDEYTELVEDLAVVYLTLKEGAQIFQQSMVLWKRVQGKLKQWSRWQQDREPALPVELVQAK